MRKLALIPLMVLAVAVGAARAWAGPLLTVEEPSFDFGTVLQGDKVEHAFRLTNRGDAPLEIHKVKTTCGCTVARDYPREIAPGASGEMTVTFDSSRRRGRQEKRITLFTNADTSPQYVVTLSGTVREIVAISPTICNFGSVAPGRVVTREMTLTNHSDRPIHLQVVPTNDPLFKVSVGDASLGPGKATKVTVEFTSNTDKPTFANLAEIRTDHPRVPVLTIRIRAEVQVPKQPAAG
jgi:hypothetical protein